MTWADERDLNDSYNDIYFHGTDADSAERISREGFSTEREKNGRTAGHGVYLTNNPRTAMQYGTHIVTAGATRTCTRSALGSVRMVSTSTG